MYCCLFTLAENSLYCDILVCKKYVKSMIERDFFNSLLVSGVFNKYASTIINKIANNFCCV